MFKSEGQRQAELLAEGSFKRVREELIKKARAEVIQKIRGQALNTPINEIRVFSISDPDHTYEYVRQEGSDVLVNDDNGNIHELKLLPASDLVNVAIFEKEMMLSVGADVFDLLFRTDL